MPREQLQRAAAQVLARNKRLVCMWATGVGKSGIALRFINANPQFRCLILVPEQANIENWRDEFKKFHIDDSNVEIACYASLHKYENSTWDFLVLDEVPHMDTEKRKNFCQSVKGTYILALGAVIDPEELATLQSVYGQFVISRITLEDAIAKNILPPPIVNVLHMSLDSTEPKHWYRGKLYTEKGLYDLYENKVKAAVEAYDNSKQEFHKRRMLSLGSQRKRFLGMLKEDAAKRVCDFLRKLNKRFICFCSSIDQAERLGGENAFTSKSQKSMKHLEKFNNHEINSLFVVGKLIEGQNLKDIQYGVIVQLGGTQRITVQEIGRVLRAKNPQIYIPVFDGTKDDSFLYTLTASIPADYIRHFNL